MQNDPDAPETATVTAGNGERVPDGDEPMDGAIEQARSLEHRGDGIDEESNGEDDVA